MTQPNGISLSLSRAAKYERLPSGELILVEEAPTLEQLVDADIANFARYFCEELKNDSLSRAERAILKTYLWWKTNEQPRKALEQDPNRSDGQ